MNPQSKHKEQAPPLLSEQEYSIEVDAMNPYRSAGRAI